MSNRTNHRREEERRTEHGPRFESKDPGKGCNSTHVARGRAKWKRRLRRSRRRTESIGDSSTGRTEDSGSSG